MLLIVGGEASGKRSFAESLGYRPEEMACALTGAQRVVYGAHTLVSTQEDVLPALAALRTREVVIMNEVGSGVIPAVRPSETSPSSSAWPMAAAEPDTAIFRSSAHGRITGSNEARPQ